MAIYTRNGDYGKTSLYGGKSAFKSDRKIEAYGTIDELSSYLGVVLCQMGKHGEDMRLLTDIQKDLYLMMGYLAGAPTSLSFIDDQILRFEKDIDLMEATLPPLTHFILPQGCPASSHLHVARTICRRAERQVVALNEKVRQQDNPIIRYLNRLSDLLFILARKYNTNETVITNL